MIKNKPKVPKTKLKMKTKPVHYDITEMITRYLAIINMEKITKDRGFKEEHMFFNGLKRGYIDWLEALQITDEQFERVQQTVNKERVVKFVEDMFGAVMEGRQKAQRRIILPGEVNIKRAINEIDEAWRRKFHEK